MACPALARTMLSDPPGDEECPQAQLNCLSLFADTLRKCSLPQAAMAAGRLKPRWMVVRSGRSTVSTGGKLNSSRPVCSSGSGRPKTRSDERRARLETHLDRVKRVGAKTGRERCSRQPRASRRSEIPPSFLHLCLLDPSPSASSMAVAATATAPRPHSTGSLTQGAAHPSLARWFVPIPPTAALMTGRSDQPMFQVIVRRLH